MTDISSYYSGLLGKSNFWQVPVRIERATDAPLDSSTLFKSYADALTYAQGGVISCAAADGDSKKVYTQSNAYPGQFIAVVDETTGATTGYIVGGNKNLIELGSVESTLSGMNVVVGDQKVPLTIVDNKLELSVGGGLKMENGVLTVAEISTVSDISANATSNDPAATSAIVKYVTDYTSEKATVTVEKQTTADDGYASTYVIKQGGVELGTKINIPKDFLVKSANLCSDANGKYIDFVINTLGNDGQETHLSIDVDDLVDEYFGGNTKEINVIIDSDTNTISAVINDNSIERSKVAESILSSLNAADAAEGKITAAINALDVNEVTGFIKSIKQVDGKISAIADAKISSSDIADISAFATKADIATLEGLTALNEETVDQIIQATQGLSNYTELTDFNQITSDHNDRLTALESTSTDHETRLTVLESTSTDLTARVGTAESNIADIANTLKTVSSDYITQAELDDAIAGVDVTDQLKTLSADTLAAANGYTDGKIADLNISQYATTETVNGVSQKADDALAAAAKALTDANKHTDDAIAGLNIDQYAKTADVESTYATKTTVTTVSDDLDNVEEALSKTGISILASNNGKVASTVDVENTLTSANKYTDDKIANIGTPLRFVGVTTDENLAEGSEKADISGLNFGDGIRDGDVALNTINGTEFVWHGGKWHIIGDQNNHATTAALKAEEDARKAADAVLLSAIDNKFFYGNHNGSIISAESLSVVNISRADYHNLEAEKKNANNVVYIVNNDGAYSMYGETISELSTTGVEGTSEAANTLYVDTKVQEAINEIPLSVSQLVWDITTISCGGADL